MPLYRVLALLIALDLGLLVVTMTLGVMLDGKEAMMTHFTMGMFASMFTCFIHVLVLFYLIGTGKDVREAAADYTDLRERFDPWVRAQKRRVFPPACFAIVFIIVATLMGAEVHSRVLSVDRGVTLPLRTVTGWWVHGTLVVIAVATSAWAFWQEYGAVKENRRGIEELNAELARRESVSAAGELPARQ